MRWCKLPPTAWHLSGLGRSRWWAGNKTSDTKGLRHISPEQSVARAITPRSHVVLALVVRRMKQIEEHHHLHLLAYCRHHTTVLLIKWTSLLHV